VKAFPARYRDALEDPNIRSGLLGFQRSWREARDAEMLHLEAQAGVSFDELRNRLASIKDQIIADPREHLDRFAERASAAGAQVVEVDGAHAANDYLGTLCQERGIRLVTKGKSMLTEEIGLNTYLEAKGVTAVETDLGEWLLQLAGEHPSHLVMPAIHKRRHQIASLLEASLGRPFDPDDITTMVRSARTELRQAFVTARLGVSGANALIASTGTVLLVSNEGNHGMCTSLPPIHVVLAGFDKLLPCTKDAIAQVRLLARSATGQPITTYTTFITGPSPGHELHVVLVDNGRSTLAADPELREALRCIRCGACANVCPPYQVVGGHAFGHIYSGAIGLVVTAAHHGLDAAAGPQSLCVSCGACATACPVAIPLPTQILAVRRQTVSEGTSRAKRLVFRAYASRPLTATVLRIFAVGTRPLRHGPFTRIPQPLARRPALSRHLSWRTPPALPIRPARSSSELTARASAGLPLAETPVTGRRVALFLQCMADRVAPSIPLSAARLLRAAGAEVTVPRRQHCCGLVAFDAGDWDGARRMAKATIRSLEDAATAGDHVVTPAPSCVVAMTQEYPRLFAHDPDWERRAGRLAGRVYDLVSYMAGPARLPTGVLAAGDRRPVTVHRFCQSGTMLGQSDEMADLIEDLCGVEILPLPEVEMCCGFGGSTSLLRPDTAKGILQRKLDCVRRTGASLLVTDNPGCVLHLRGGADAAGEPVQVLHLAEYLAARIPDPADPCRQARRH
jgi:L-lactate dehydrogenase complex protein LldF